MTFGSLFAGIGGMDLGLERAGMTCKWQVEINEYARRVLSKSVHPVGKPIICSADPGSSIPRPTFSQSQSVIVKPSFTERPLAVPFRDPFASDAVSVGNNEHPFTALRGTKGSSRKHVPFSIKPESGQVSEYVAKSPVNKVSDILHDDEFRSKIANDSRELLPQSRMFSVDSVFFPTA